MGGEVNGWVCRLHWRVGGETLTRPWRGTLLPNVDDTITVPGPKGVQPYMSGRVGARMFDDETHTVDIWLTPKSAAGLYEALLLAGWEVEP